MYDFPLEIFNISVVDTPFLKDYYWCSLNISLLNKELYKFQFFDQVIDVPVHLDSPTMKFPPMPINTCPIKIILHLCNTNTEEDVEFNISRIKCCPCQIQEAQVAFNTYKKLFICPHRYLLNITPRTGVIKAKESNIIILHVAYNIVGKHLLIFKMTVNEKFVVNLKFQVEVVEFDPGKCLITKSLFPVQCSDYDSYYQPIWFCNPYGNDIALDFFTDTPGLQFEWSTLYIKRYSVNSLMVKYKPSTQFSTIKLIMCYYGIKSEVYLPSSNSTSYKMLPVQNCPRNDIPCFEAPYIIFKNSLTYNLKINGCSSRMIAVHNYTKQNIMCKWNLYELPNFFKIDINPNEFDCKPEHPVFCLVTVTSYSKRSIFHHIPLTCEIHKCQYPPLQEYEKLHSEQESIDDPKIFEPTLLTKIYLNINLVIEGLQQVDIDLNVGNSIQNIQLPQNYDRNCIEKMLWNHIFSDDYVYLLANKTIVDYTYSDCNEYHANEEVEDQPHEITHNASIAIMRRLTSNAIEEISKQWRFIPVDFYSTTF